MDAIATDENRIPAHVWRIGLVVIVGSMMSILDTTIVNVALDTLAHRLHATIDQIQWVATGYLLALAAVIPVTGWAARRFGPKRLYLISLILFTSGSALCGLASSSTELIVFRVLQGAGGGMIFPIGQIMIAEAAGPKRMGRVMGVIAVPMMIAPILGPTVGGLIIDNASWRWIFMVNVPIGVIGVLTALRMLPAFKRDMDGAPDPLDVLGLVLLVAGMPLFTYGLAEIGSTGSFTNAKVVFPCIGGIVLVTLFVLHALRDRHPLLDVRLWRRPSFSSAGFAMFCLSAALFGGMVLLPLYWQAIRHQSPLQTGLLTAPQGISAALMMPLSGRLTDRFGGGPLALFGVVVTAVTTVPFALIGAHTSIVWLCIVMFGRGIGIGFAFMPAFAAAYTTLDRAEISHATPQLNTLQRLGGSLGIALLAVVLQRALVGQHTLAAQAGAYGTAFWAAVILTTAAIIPCVILWRTEHRVRAAARGAERNTSAPPTKAPAEAAPV